MPSPGDWQIAPSVQPRPGDYAFDLDRALASVVSLRATVPDDAFTADILGTDRAGSGVLIREDGLVLTIGYLITEAERIWLGLSNGLSVPGHALAYDQETGFGLVQALAKVDLPALPLGRSAGVQVGERVVIGGSGGRARSVAARVIARQEFAGYWEYVLDDAIFTAPAHPFWGGTALIGAAGDLLGVGSLRLERGADERSEQQLNMIVPIDLLKPILDDMLTIGAPNRPPRPWLGLYAVEVDDQVIVAGLANNGPAERGGLHSGDAVLAVAETEIATLAGFFRAIWEQGPAGVTIPLTVYRDGEPMELRIASANRSSFLKAPRLH